MNLELIDVYNKPHFYVLIEENFGIYIESPDDGEKRRESILHLFLNVEEAVQYKELINQVHESEYKIERVNLTHLVKTINILDGISQKLYKCPIRIDISSLGKTVDTIWTKYRTIH
jgi:hypothetical protein